MTPKSDVDDYIAAAAPKARPMLRQLRRVIKKCAPKANERLSYGMPYYDLGGRLVYFAAFTKHVSLFIWGRPMKLHATAVKPYRVGKATLRFPLGTKLPLSLLTRLVKARVAEQIAKTSTR